VLLYPKMSQSTRGFLGKKSLKTKSLEISVVI
jgi:hypothetical protein